MEQKALGFLEHLYSGTLRKDLCFTDFTTIREDRVQDFVDRYHEIVGRYSPLNLEKKGTIPDELMEQFRELGMFGMTIGEEYGGLGFSVSEYLRVVEEMSRTDMAIVLIPLAHLSIGMKGIVLFGNEAQKKKYLPKAASGEMVFAYCLTEPKAGSDAQHITTEAKLSDDGEHYILNGGKTYITNGNYAHGFTVFAQLDPENPGKKMAAFIVERDWEGVKVGKDMPKMGLKVSSTTPIQFKNVKVPKENLIADEGDGFKIAMNILNYGRLALGAASAGLMGQSLRDMQQRSSSRKQFGMPIREFELIQEKMVRTKAHAFAARNVTFFTANLLEKESLANVAMESSHTKLYGTDNCWDALYDALQTAGGAGFIQTLPYEKRMRDFRVTTIFEGTSEIHSIYPPLTLFRQFGGELKGKGGVGKLLYLNKLARTNLLKGLSASHPTLNRALKVASRGETMFRGLLKDGFLRYGKNITQAEFHLRRMTHLSMSMLALLASVASMESRAKAAGASASSPREGAGAYSEEELALLEYLVEEAIEVQRRTANAEGRGIEKAHEKVMATIE